VRRCQQPPICWMLGWIRSTETGVLGGDQPVRR
jgi:hypothetical protein